MCKAVITQCKAKTESVKLKQERVKLKRLQAKLRLKIKLWYLKTFGTVLLT